MERWRKERHAEGNDGLARSERPDVAGGKPRHDLLFRSETPNYRFRHHADRGGGRHFWDTKEGAFAIRLADAFTEKKGLKMLDADGRAGMANVWGKRSNWVDYVAEVDGEKLGVAMFDHPLNPHHPTYWHARDYGLFALNPFGQQAFDPKAEESQLKLAKGQKLTFRWRVMIHPGDFDSAKLNELYKDYSAKR